MRIIFSVTLLCVTLIGCATERVNREARLLTMAAGEAQQIVDPEQKLARQLNFANVQMQHGMQGEARQSLMFAQQTLRDAAFGDLKPQIRIAGWVSISELSRQAGDRATAQAACDQAVMLLTSLNPVHERPQYVVGVSQEVRALQGNAAAGKLLEASVDWVKTIGDVSLQRVALSAIADAAFDCDDYVGGLNILRADNDPVWRSDTLKTLAEQGFTPISLTQSFEKPVDFRSVFQSKPEN